MITRTIGYLLKDQNATSPERRYCGGSLVDHHKWGVRGTKRQLRPFADAQKAGFSKAMAAALGQDACELHVIRLCRKCPTPVVGMVFEFLGLYGWIRRTITRVDGCIATKEDAQWGTVEGWLTHWSGDRLVVISTPEVAK